jgi:hypothetical protein
MFGLISSLHLNGEGIASRAKSVWCSGCMKTTDQGSIVYDTRGQHQKMEDLMACAYKVKASGKPALRYLLSVSYTPMRKSISKKNIHNLDA